MTTHTLSEVSRILAPPSTKGDIDPGNIAMMATQKASIQQINANGIGGRTSGGSTRKSRVSTRKSRVIDGGSNCSSGTNPKYYEIHSGSHPGPDNFGNDPHKATVNAVKHAVKTVVDAQHDNLQQGCEGTIGGGRRRSKAIKNKSKRNKSKRNKSKRNKSKRNKSKRNKSKRNKSKSKRNKSTRSKSKSKSKKKGKKR